MRRLPGGRWQATVDGHPNDGIGYTRRQAVVAAVRLHLRAVIAHGHPGT